jgi:hypothetical protein
LYVYSKKEEGTVYGAENKNLYKLLRRGQTMKESIAKDNST